MAQEIHIRDGSIELLGLFVNRQQTREHPAVTQRKLSVELATLLVLELKSTYLRRSVKDAWAHRNSTLRKAGLQLHRKVEAIRRALEHDESLQQALGLDAARKPDITAWIVDTSVECHTPKLAFVAPLAGYVAASGKAVNAEGIDLCARIFSMGKLHHAMTGTGAVAIAVAAAIPGTVVSRILGEATSRGEVRFGHPSGTLTVGAAAAEVDGEWQVAKATMSRGARRLMEEVVFVPAAAPVERVRL